MFMVSSSTAGQTSTIKLGGNLTSRRYLIEIGGCNGQIFPKPFISVVEDSGCPCELLGKILIRRFALFLFAKGLICQFFEEIRTLHMVKCNEL